MLIALRSLLFTIVQAALTVAWAMLSMLTLPFSPFVRYRFISTWSRMMVWLAKALCGIRYQVRGMENLPQRPAVILAKHQSTWETLAFQELLPPQAWVLKRSLLRIPFFGWALALTSPIAIDRDAGMRALKQTLEQGRERLAQGFWIVVFPEGHRYPPGARTTWHVGGAWLAVQTGAPVVPIAHNAGYLWPRDSFLKRPGTVTISIGPAIDPKGMKADELNQRVRDWVEQEVQRLGAPH